MSKAEEIVRKRFKNHIDKAVHAVDDALEWAAQRCESVPDLAVPPCNADCHNSDAKRIRAGKSTE